MPVQFTTELPATSVTSLDNGIEDEITVHVSDSIDYGSYDYRYKQTDESSWTVWGTTEENTTSATITGLPDGEEFEVQVRTTTEHVTTDWSSSTTVVTNFPSPTNPSASLSSTAPKTEIDYQFDDHADNENGVRVLRQRQYDYGWGPGQEVEDLAANSGTGTVSGTDDTVSPGNTYRYQFEAYTEDAVNQSSPTSSVTTDSSGRPRTATGSSGWTVEIEHASGTPLRPRLLDDPQFKPTLNGLPRVEIPVPRDEKWQASGFEDATLSVWQDGRILPIDRLVTVRMEADRTVLIGEGGSELEDRVQAEFDNKEAHLAAEELLQQETSYVANVDDPASSTQSNTKMDSGDTGSELTGALLNTISSTDRVQPTESGTLALQQSGFVAEGENYDTGPGTAFGTGYGWASDGAVAAFTASGDTAEWSFTMPDSPGYTIPASAVDLRVRRDGLDSSPPLEFRLIVNGTTYLLDAYASGTGLARGWSNFKASDPYSGTAGSGYSGPDLQPGDTVTVEIAQTGSGDFYYPDVIALIDNRFSFFWDDDNGGSGGYLDGPEHVPGSQRRVFDDIASAFNVVGGRMEATIDDTSGSQALGLSNDQGATWVTGGNTKTLEGGFSSAGSSIRWRITLSGYGTQDATPQTGVRGQSLDAYALYADLEDTPVLNSQTYDDSLKSVLNQIAKDGNSIWGLQRDSDGWRIEWTQPGQRTSDTDASIANYDVRKRNQPTYEKAVIKGSAQPVRGESFTANHGTAVTLDNAHLIPSSDIVRNPSDGTVYALGTDYQLDRQSGTITALSGGSMSDGSVFEIDYQYKVQGSYTAEGASDPRTVVRTIPSLAVDTACTNAALYLIQQVQEPIWEATVTIPRLDAGWSLVDDLALEGLPVEGERLTIQTLEQTPREVVLQLGSRRSVGEVISDLESRLSSVSDRV